MSEITREERARLLRVQLGFLRDAEMRVRNAGRDVPEDLEAAIAETTLALAKISNHPKRVRNEAAVCGNCPYMEPCTNERDKNYGVCCLSPMTRDLDSLVMPDKTWCGQHPAFWKEGNAMGDEADKNKA